jgi:Cu/Zn superoxide dismutase
LRSITKAALGGLAGCALVLGGTQMASGGAVEEYNYSANLVDLRTGDVDLTGAPDPHRTTFDDASGTLRIKEYPDGVTSYKLRIDGIATSAAGTIFGAHLHTGPCEEGFGTKAGPHYNHDVAAHGKTLPTKDVPLPPNPAEISSNTETWFDVVPSDNGLATSNVSVPFVPDDSLLADLVTQSPGVMSVVIHEFPTNTAPDTPTVGQFTGGAGLRQACLPLPVSQWAPTE